MLSHDHDDHVTFASHPGEEGAPVAVIEADRRLSQSVLWDLQRRYFAEAGISAWSTSRVPHYVTSNPALAHAYAAVFLGFLRDLHASGLDVAEPVTLVELGAGSGRFAYLFLRAFTDLLARTPLAGVRVRYVMTDCVETNVRFFQEHAWLRPFVERGVLDFAVVDAERDREIHLLRAGVTLAPGSLRNPLGVIANYVFDGLRQDAFHFAGGQLQEQLISLTVPEPVEDSADPSLLDRLEISFAARPAPLDYYGDPELDSILRGYAARLDGATVLFPVSAMRSLGRLAELAGGRMLLLSGDRGDIREEALPVPPTLGLARHGSFSLDVNYHAIAELVRGRGGEALATEHRRAHLHVSAFLLGAHPTGHAETRFAYEEAVGRAGPDDFFSLRRGIEGSYDALDTAQILSLLRMSRWDVRILRDCLPVLWKHQPSASARACQDVVRAVTRVWESYFPIGEEQDLAFELGLLLHAYGGHREALALFGDSVRIHGDDARTRWNMGLCHYALGEVEAAFARFGEASRLDPGFVPAGAMQVKA